MTKKNCKICGKEFNAIQRTEIYCKTSCAIEGEKINREIRKNKKMNITFVDTCDENNVNLAEDGTGAMKMINDYCNQMAKNHAKKIDDNFWLVVKKKPKWMPDFLYKAVIKNLVEFHQYK